MFEKRRISNEVKEKPISTSYITRTAAK